MASPVSWETAERVATWFASGRSPFSPAPVAVDAATEAQLRQDFAELTEQAERLVVGSTGLPVPVGSARGVVVDRPEWARRNLSSFQRLLGPVLARLAERSSLPGPLGGAARTTAGAQLGLVLGWMSTRVLGQYDLLLTEGDDAGDLVAYVGPNIVSLERQHHFPSRQFRLWIALHEVTHRCQFVGVPWLRAYFLSLVDQAVTLALPDPGRFGDALRRAADAVRERRNPLEEAGLLGLLSSPEQLEVIGRIQALMSLLEGHGDVVMGRAGAGEVPEAARFARVLNERRSRASFPARVLQQMLGIEAKLKQYALGERFIAGVEAAGGPELFARVWEGPEMLPTMGEIRQPSLWVARAGPPKLATG